MGTFPHVTRYGLSTVSGVPFDLLSRDLDFVSSSQGIQHFVEFEDG